MLLAAALITVGVVAEVRFGQVVDRSVEIPAGAVVELPRPSAGADVRSMLRRALTDEPAVVSRQAQRNGQTQLALPPPSPSQPASGGGSGGSNSGGGTVSGIGGCTVVDPAPANQWRAQRGLPPLIQSDELVRQSCAWSLELLRRGQLSHGAPNEVVHMSSHRATDSFAAWRNSSEHYELLITSRASTTHIGCARASGNRADGVAVHYTTCRMNW